MVAQFIYKILARKSGLWRVDGIGPVRDHSRLGKGATVHFSGLTEDGLIDPYRKSSRNGTVSKLWIQSASLCNFKVGSIWQDGKRIAGPLPKVISSVVDVSRVRLVKLGQSVHLNGQWASTVIPESHFCFGENRELLSSTLYAIVPVLGDLNTQWLVVPASELLRFYSGVSTRFLSAVLQGHLDNYVDWEKSRMEDGLPIVHVKQRVYLIEAIVLARAVAVMAAKDALLGPHKHLSMVNANNAPLNEKHKCPMVIKAGFPFTDTTKLTVLGKRMPLTDKNKGAQQWAVFAMEILECTHGLGFSELVVEDDEQQKAGGVGAGSHPPEYKPKLDNEDEEESELEEVKADNRPSRLVVRSYTNLFSTLGRVRIEYWHPLGEGEGKHAGPKIILPINAFTVGDGSYEKDAKGNLGISEIQNHVAKIDRNLSLFLDMLGHLRAAKQDWRVVTRKLNDGLVRGGELIAVFPEKIGKRRTWHKVVDPDGSERTRLVVWVEVQLNKEGQFIYLVEMELRSGETGQCTLMLHKHDFSRLEDTIFTDLLVLTAVQNRWPDRHNKWKNQKHDKRAQDFFRRVRIYRINHPSVPKSKDEEKKLRGGRAKLNPESWSNALLDRINELLHM